MGDRLHREKVIETLWLFWVFVLIGFDNGMLGPCLPDLQNSVGASFQDMSYVFFLQGAGTLLGSIFAFLLEGRLNRRLLMGVYTLAGSVVNILIPMVPRYFYLLALFLLQGITKGMADFSAMSMCNVLWEEDKSLPFQFIVVGAGISTFVSPFIAQPFIDDTLPPPTLSQPTSSTSSSNVCPTKVTSANRTYPFINGLLSPPGGNSAIMWPFVIVGLVTLPAAVAFIYFYLTRPPFKGGAETFEEITLPKSGSSKQGQGREDSEARVENQTTRLLGSCRENDRKKRRTVLLFRVLVILLNVPIFGLLLTYADLLTSIGMSSPLCMTAVDASYFNTVLWGSAMIGRAVSAATLMCVSMGLQLLLCSVAVVIVGIVLVASPRSDVLALWFGTAGLALFVTPSMPGYIAWSGDYAPITPFFMNLCLCAAGIGEIFLPFVGGQLMAVYGSWYMMLFTLFTMILMLFLFIAAAFVGRKIKRLKN